MRFRTDSRWIAEAKRRGKTFEGEFDGERRSGWYPSKTNRARWNATPPPAPGDTWRVHWYKPPDEPQPGPIAGYDICCPKCGEIHGWTTALNCASKRQLPEWEFTDPTTGVKRMVPGGFACDHSGKSSCWTWTGSAEAGTLSATPSLHCLAEKGGCGWHGYLTNGELAGA